MGSQATIGIVGGGQLGRMLTLAALPLGFKVIVVDPNKNSPAAQVGAQEITADLYDQAALKKLARLSDFITVEIEHLDAQLLGKLAKTGKQINPSPKIIGLIQDKLLQKQFLRKAGVPVADFREMTDKRSAKQTLKDFGGKMLIKTRHGAYDGRGNALIENESDIDKALKLFAGRKLYAEAYIPFVKELATMVARSQTGQIAVYPIVETIHQRNICLEVLAPAPISEQAYKKAKSVATRTAKLLAGAGTFGIEMFLTKDGQVLINEIAPRVHNSGHYTIEGNRTSQFEQHIRAITGLPLGSAEMITPAAVMINILGERNGPTRIKGLNNLLDIAHVSVHIYGKSPTKVDRKMGHITATGQTLSQARNRARKARQNISI